MTRKPRRWDAVCEEDPAGGLLNLFDVWIAFSVALLLALFGYIQNTPQRVPSADSANLAKPVSEALRNPQKTPRFRPTHSPLTGTGTRLGTAYQLQNGDVVYVPDADVPTPQVK